MKQLKSYLNDKWVAGEGDGQELTNPATGEALARCSTKGLDLASALGHARSVGGPTLRAMTFQERGALLANIAEVMHEHRQELLDLSRDNTGTTHSDSKFDIDGASATLAAYGKYGEALGDRTFLLDGEGEAIGRSPRFCGQHIKVPLRGIAVHINAFNFPAWGYAEKLACAFLAGMPVLTKPATSTALPTARLAEVVVESGVLPAGAWSFLCGSVGDLLNHLTGQDVVAFTGSANTGAKIRSNENLIKNSVRVNVEADSLNSVLVGPDVERGSDTYDLFLRELAREMTQKSGQKCTATRRVILPSELLDSVIEDLVIRLEDYPFGLPTDSSARVGTLATLSQFPDVVSGMRKLSEHCRVVIGAIPDDGQTDCALMHPVVFACEKPLESDIVHELEVFGPCTTLMPYDGSLEQGATIVRKGGGSLVSTLYSDDLKFTRSMLLEVAPYSGRVLLGSKRVAEHSTGPGLVLPNMSHGGPGRAGGGQELGGLRGLDLYTQLCAVQGARPVLDRIL